MVIMCTPCKVTEDDARPQSRGDLLVKGRERVGLRQRELVFDIVVGLIAAEQVRLAWLPRPPDQEHGRGEQPYKHCCGAE